MKPRGAGEELEAGQLDLFGRAASEPCGFHYQPDVLTDAQAVDIARELRDLAFEPFDFHGHLANRRVAGFGLRYDYARRRVEAADAIPDFLIPLRAMIAEIAAAPAETFEQVLINQYRPGAGIGWHRDKLQFGIVVAVSLGAPCTLRFRRLAGGGWDRRSFRVSPRSVYSLTGPARYDWEHSIPPVDQERHSITFRTLAKATAKVTGAGGPPGR